MKTFFPIHTILVSGLVVCALALPAFGGDERSPVSQVKDAGRNLGAAFQEMGRDAGDALKELGSDVKKEARRTGKDITEGVEKTEKEVRDEVGKGFFSKIGEDLSSALAKVGATMSKHWEELKEALGFSQE